MDYRRLGWSPLPLPFGKKKDPPKGWTGNGAPYPSGADVAEWSDHKPTGNVALRMPDTVIGLDLDAYKPEGVATWTDALTRLGELPDAPVSTSRADGQSGIRFYRVPAGRKWKNLGSGVESIHHGWRYAVVAPCPVPEPVSRGPDALFA